MILEGAGLLGTSFVESNGVITDKGYGAVAGIISAIICTVLYKSSRLVSPYISRTYREQSHEDKRNWDSRYSSNVHTIACVYFAYHLLYKSDFYWREDPIPHILRTCRESYIAMGISLGYFVVDMATILKHKMGGLEMLLHHVGSLLAVATSFFSGNGHMFTIWMLFTEVTTPLINNRWWLDKLEMKSHPLYVINGLAIVFCWIPARILPFPPFFYLLWKIRDQIPHLTLLSKLLVMSVPFILSALNLYWFQKILKGAYKVLFVKKSKAT